MIQSSSSHFSRFGRLAAWLPLGIALLVGCANEPGSGGSGSDAATAAYAEAQVFAERFELDKAEASLHEAIAADSTYAMAWLQLGRIQATRRDYEAAKRAVDQAWSLREGAREVDKLQIAFVRARFQEDTLAAEEYYQELVKLYPREPDVLEMRVRRAGRDGEFEEALRLANLTLEVDPSRINMHNMMGYTYLELGDYESAIQSLERYAYYAPDQANPRDSLGEAYLHTGRYEESIAELRQALTLDPTFIYSAEKLALPLAITGRIESALQILDTYRALFEERGMTQTWEMRRLIVLSAGHRWDDLAESSKALIASMEGQDCSPQNAEAMISAYAYHALAVLEQGDVERAAALMTEVGVVAGACREVLPENFALDDIFKLNEAYLKARLFRQAGVPQRGIEELAAALQGSSLGPHYLTEFATELARDQLADGDPQAALASARSILASIPTHPSLNLVAARAQAALGQNQAALRHLRVYLEIMANADPGHEGVVEAETLATNLLPAK